MNTASPAPESSPRSKLPIWLTGGAILIVLVVVAGGAYFVELHNAFCPEGICKSHVERTTWTTTWMWDGTKWTAQGSVSNVGGNKVGAWERLAFDAGRGQLVLIANLPTTDFSSYTTTWTWSGGSWQATRASTSHGLVGTLVYDTHERQLL